MFRLGRLLVSRRHPVSADHGKSSFNQTMRHHVQSRTNAIHETLFRLLMTNRPRFFTVAATAFIAFAPEITTAENWPQWRGPNFNGSTSEKKLPTQWSRTEGVVWTTPMPGT